MSVFRNASLEPMVPRRMLEEANKGLHRLKKKLEEQNALNRKEMEDALRSMQYQIRTLQTQARTSEEQLKRALAREKDLRSQLSHQDVDDVFFKLRKESEELRKENDALRQIEMEYAMFKASATDLTAEIQQLKAKLQRVEVESCSRVETLQDEKERLLQTSIADQEQMKSEFLRIQSELEEKVQSLERKNEELTGEQMGRPREMMEAEISRLKNDVDKMKQTLVNTEIEKNILSEKYEEAMSKLKNLEKKSEGLQQSNTALKEELMSKEEDLKSMESVLNESHETSRKEEDEYCRQIAELTRKLSNNSFELQKAEVEAASLREQLNQEIKNLENEKRHLRESLREERDRYEKLQEENSRTIFQLTQAHERTEFASKRRETELQSRIENLLNDLSEMKLRKAPDRDVLHSLEDSKKEHEVLRNSAEKSMRLMEGFMEGCCIAEVRLENSIKDLEYTLSDLDRKVQEVMKKLHLAQLMQQLESSQKLLVQEQLKLSLRDSQSVFMSLSAQDNSEPAASCSQVATVSLECLERMRLSQEDLSNSRSRSLSAPALTRSSSAIGLILDGCKVDSIVPGSPAFACGLIAPGDEILMVNGRAASPEDAMALLRGEDKAGAVVEVVLSKVDGSSVKVVLPKVSVSLVINRQTLNQSLTDVQEMLISLFSESDKVEAIQALEKLSGAVREMDRLNFEVEMQQANFISRCRESHEQLLLFAKKCLLHLDATHQKIHDFQFELEQQMQSACLSLLSSSSASHLEQVDKERVHRLQSLSRSLQDEVSKYQIQMMELEQDLELARDKVNRQDSEMRLLQSAQDSLKARISQLQSRLHDKENEASMLPCAVRLDLEVNYLDMIADQEAKAVFTSQLIDDLCYDLNVSRSCFEIICFYRSAGAYALLKISGESSFSPNLSSLSGLELAQALAKNVDSYGSRIRSGSAGKFIREVEVHGPVAELTARAFRACLLDLDSDLSRAAEDAENHKGRMAELQAAHRAQLKQEEKIREEIVADCEKRVRAAAVSYQEQLAKALEREKEGWEKKSLVAASSLQAQREKERTEVEGQQAEAERQIKSFKKEVAELRSHKAELESKVTTLQQSLEQEKDRVEQEREALEKLRTGCRKVDEILLPEFSSCLLTLNNISSEISFFHSHCIRAVSLSGLHEAGAKQISDAQKSKDMIDKDVNVLRLQLEALAHFSYQDPFQLAKEIEETVSFVEERKDELGREKIAAGDGNILYEF
eukprot:747870-Hanusia_phi.AAC.9